MRHTGADAVTDSVTDSVCKLHYYIETCGLQEHLIQKTRKIYNAGNCQIADQRQVFVNAGAGFERTGGFDSKRKIERLLAEKSNGINSGY